MTVLLIANIVLMSLIVVAIVALLAGAIFTSLPQVQPELSANAARARRVARQRARGRAYGSYEGVSA